MESGLFTTADGSHSLRSHHFGAAYHSTHGALNESVHIFIEAGLRPLLEEGPQSLHILEMGLGTALNALLTWRVASEREALTVHYTSFETHPVGPERAVELNYPELLGMPQEEFLLLHRLPFGKTHRLSQNFYFTKRHEDFLAASPEPTFNLLYYDAFAPEQQPELWTAEAMLHCRRWLRDKGRLVTYCAKGQFKRNLRAAGFAVEALPGPVGKREITRANLIDLA